MMTFSWWSYGVLRSDPSIQLVNGVGLVLQSLYVLCFYLFTSEKVATLKGIVLTAVFVVCLNFYIQTESDTEVSMLRLGLLSSTMSVMYCAAPLASVVTVIKTKSTESLPFYLILATIGMTSSWTLYGLIIEDSFVTVPNSLGCLIAIGQLMLFSVYPASSHEKYVV